MKSVETLISSGDRAYQGALRLEASTKLAFNTAAVIGEALQRVTGTGGETGQVGTQGAYNRASADYARARGSLLDLEKAAAKFCAAAVNVLKPFLGQSWNAQWLEAGFTQGSLAQAKDPLRMLLELRAFFRQNPAKESPLHSVGAAQADTLAAQLGAGRQQVDSAKQARKAALLTRNESLVALNKRLVGLRKELSLVLAPEDPRWFEFGFPRPADGAIPWKVSGLSLRLGGTGEVIASWYRSARAENYRVSVQVSGGSAEPEQVALTPAKEIVIPNLRAGTHYVVLVSAVNGSGETIPVNAEIALP